MSGGGGDIGYYTLPVIPSFRGGEAKIGRDLDKAFGVAGGKAGKALTKGAATAIAADRAIEKATEAKAKAADRLADAVGRAKVAEKQYFAAQASGSTTKQVQAEERRAAAIRKVTAETRAQTAASKELDRVMAEVGRGGGNNGRGGRLGAMIFGSEGPGGLSTQVNGVMSAAGKAGLAGMAAILTVGAGAMLVKPFLAGMQSAFDTGIDFDKVANTFSGVTDSVGPKGQATMNAFRATARGLGSDTQLAGVSAADAGKAMLELAKGGLTANEAMEAARGTVQLATAGQLDAAEAAKYQTAAMNMFKLGAGDATHVADLFAAAANASSADVSDLGMALQQGGSVASGFGTSLDDTITALTVFSKWGVNGSDAGTMLKTSLQSITDQGKPAQEAIHALGLELYDSNDKFVGVESMMKQVAAASKRMGEQQFQAATATLFGSDAMRGSMIAANGGAEAWDAVSEAVGRQGAAADMAAANMQGLPGIVEAVDNTLEGMKMSAYDAASGLAAAFGSEGLGGLQAISDWFASHKASMIGFFQLLGDTAIFTGQQFLLFASGAVQGIALVVNAIGDMTGAVERGMAAFARMTGDTEKADYWDAQADGAFGWADGLYAIHDGLDAAKKGLDDFKPKLDAAADAAQKAAHFTDSLGGATTALRGADIVITDNAPEVIAKIDATKFAVEQIPGTKEMKVVPLTDEARAELNDFRKSQGQEPVKLEVVGNTDPLRNAIQEVSKDPIRMNLTLNTPAGANPLLDQARARLGLAPGQAPAPLPGFPPGRAGGGIAGRTSAGRLYGPGTGTSDSILGLDRNGIPTARVSDGEGIVKRSAMDAGGDLVVAALNRLPGYAGGYSGDAMPPDVAAAMGLVGTKYSRGSRTDCSGMVARVINRALGLPESGLMSTKTAQDWLAARGFQPGTGGPGTINVGWYDHGPNPNDGHMAMTLSDGTNAEAGGSNGVFTLGAGAKGANSPGFDQHMFLPTAYGEGPGSSGGGGFGSSTSYGGSSSGGANVVDAGRVAKAEQGVVDADAKVAIQEQQLKELKDTATASQRMQAEDEVRRAKIGADNARKKLAEEKAGKPGKGSKSGKGDGGDDLGPLGEIAGSFLKETFGFDGLPNLADLGPIKLLKAIMGLDFNPVDGDGGAAGGGGNGPLGGLGDLLGLGGGGGGGGGLPFGMIPNAAPIGSPASGQGNGPNPGPDPATSTPDRATGDPTQPAAVDQSMHITVQGHSTADVTKGVERTLKWNAPRQLTYAPPGS